MNDRIEKGQPTLFDAASALGDGHQSSAEITDSDVEKRPGFRKVKRLGWVPESWAVATLGDVTRTYSGGTPARSRPEYFGGNIPWIKSGEVNQGIVYYTEETITEDGLAKSSAKYVDPGTTLLCLYGATAGVIGVAGIRATINQAILAVLPYRKLDAGYMRLALQVEMPRILHRLRQGGQPNLSGKLVKQIRLRKPPMPEQRAISCTLGTWDEALAQLDALIAAKKKRLKGLMQKLLFGKMRFSKFEEHPWREVQIGKILKEVRRSADLGLGDSVRLLSVRRRSAGLFIRDKEEIQGNLKIVHEGDFLISRRQVVHGASGLARTEHHGAAVSNSYSVLVARDPDVLDIGFFNWLSKTPELYHIAYLSSYGVHIEKFIFHLRFYFKHKVRIPQDIEEQRKIASVLDDAEAEIDLLRKERNALAKQKKGLMQRLLTGEVRVIPDNICLHSKNH